MSDIIYHDMANGEKIPIAEMSDRHLQNTLSMLRKIAAKGIVVRYGSGSDPDDMYYDEEILRGAKALARMNFYAYEKEAKRRSLKQNRRSHDE